MGAFSSPVFLSSKLDAGIGVDGEKSTTVCVVFFSGEIDKAEDCGFITRAGFDGILDKTSAIFVVLDFSSRDSFSLAIFPDKQPFLYPLLNSTPSSLASSPKLLAKPYIL